MHPIDFEGANITLSKPNDMKDEQCGALRAMQTRTDDGFPLFITAWMPNKEDLEALNAGRPLFLKMIGNFFQPVELVTLDENNEPNT